MAFTVDGYRCSPCHSHDLSRPTSSRPPEPRTQPANERGGSFRIYRVAGWPACVINRTTLQARTHLRLRIRMILMRNACAGSHGFQLSAVPGILLRPGALLHGSSSEQTVCACFPAFLRARITLAPPKHATAIKAQGKDKDKPNCCPPSLHASLSHSLAR